jgi:hypothetical protein
LVPIIPADTPEMGNVLSDNPSSINETGFSLSQSVNTTKAITLTHNDNIIAFEFTALDFTNPRKNQFAYQLVGLDKNWVTTDYKHR